MEKYTPAEKAELQTSRTLSDAELIKEGAQFIPDSNDEPILNVTEKQQHIAKQLMLRESPESQMLVKLIEKIKPVYNGGMVGSLRSGYRQYADLFPDQMRTANRNGMGVEIYQEGFQTSRVFLVDGGGVPYILIERDLPDGEHYRNIVCRNFQEFYAKLAPEEKEKGEALGKELESYLEK